MSSRHEGSLLQLGRRLFRRRSRQATVATSSMKDAGLPRSGSWRLLGPSTRKQRTELSRVLGNDARRRLIAAALILAAAAAALYVWDAWR